MTEEEQCAAYREELFLPQNPQRLPPVHLFWDDPTFARMTPIVRLCVHTILAHHPTVEFHGNETLDKAIAAGKLDAEKVYAMKPQFRADVVRTFLLAGYGGIWLDCDYLCFRPVYPLWKEFDGGDFASCRYTNDWDNDVLLAPPGSRTAWEFWQRLCNRLKETDYTPPETPFSPDAMTHEWGWVGRTLMREMEQDGFRIKDLGREIVAPMRILLSLQQDQEWLGEVDPDEAGWYGVMLVNNFSGQYMKDKPVHEILQSKTIAGAFVRAAVRKLPKPSHATAAPQPKEPSPLSSVQPESARRGAGAGLPMGDWGSAAVPTRKRAPGW